MRRLGVLNGCLCVYLKAPDLRYAQVFIPAQAHDEIQAATGPMGWQLKRSGSYAFSVHGVLPDQIVEADGARAVVAGGSIGCSDVTWTRDPKGALGWLGDPRTAVSPSGVVGDPSFIEELQSKHGWSWSQDRSCLQGKVHPAELELPALAAAALLGSG